MGKIKRWFDSLFSPPKEVNGGLVTVRLPLEQAVILRSACQAVWNRKLQSHFSSTDPMSRSHLEYEIAVLERCLDAIDHAVKRHRDHQ
jgi:hypothetical protein